MLPEGAGPSAGAPLVWTQTIRGGPQSLEIRARCGAGVPLRFALLASDPRVARHDGSKTPENRSLTVNL
jgi:hypothetical protein